MKHPQIRYNQKKFSKNVLQNELPRDENIVPLVMLIKNLGKHTYLAEDEIRNYLKSEDRSISSIGTELLAKCSSSKINIDKLFDTMERFGANESPYKAGITLKNYLAKDRGLYNRIYHEFRQSSQSALSLTR